jgi:osmoprotectant transport system permease protein
VSYVIDHQQRVVELLLQHLELVALALVAALVIAVPLGIAAARARRGASLVLGTLGAIYTIPSLALLALLVQAVGLGPVPIFIALVAYAQFMLVRNVVAGLQGVDPAVRDAAMGLGMSARQSLLRVELPLAFPVVLAGIRVATVSLVAIATLGGYVGAGGLGTLIFTGLALHHSDEIIAGSILASALAIALDLLLRLGERRFTV